jgi:hypothetical protein
MDELASLTIWAVTVLDVFPALLGFIKCGYVTFNHDLGLSVGKGAL